MAKQKTRLGKTINELRRKTADKELAKSAKKLIKSWQKLMDSNRAGAHVNAHSNTTTPNASLTSPLKPRSVISPYGASNDSLSCSNSSYAPSQSLVNGKAAPASANNGNGHPALMRLKNQHTDSKTTRVARLSLILTLSFFCRVFLWSTRSVSLVCKSARLGLEGECLHIPSSIKDDR